ncbi:MAG: ParB N-terminal domain-containing protein [Dechloromonas sp.]|nr:ParB N-terminal domain-containing protein [Dechloromonas sp.]
MHVHAQPTLEVFAQITDDLATHGPEAPTSNPGRLDHGEIAKRASLFQPRTLDGRWNEDEEHIKVLATVIGKNPERPCYLDPVTVWWGGKRWYVLDGFHRLEAYKRQGVTKAIPVVVFTGTLGDAMAHAAFCNSKNKLPMRMDDKLNMAWRMSVVQPELSKRKVAEACSIANGTVGNMRSTREKLLAMGETAEDMLDHGWKRCREMAKGEELEDDGTIDYDAETRRRAESYRSRLYKAFQNKPFEDFEAFALALLLGNDRLPKRLMESKAWEAALEEHVREMREELDADDIVERWDEASDY